MALFVLNPNRPAGAVYSRVGYQLARKPRAIRHSSLVADEQAAFGVSYHALPVDDEMVARHRHPIPRLADTLSGAHSVEGQHQGSCEKQLPRTNNRNTRGAVLCRKGQSTRSGAPESGAAAREGRHPNSAPQAFCDAPSGLLAARRFNYRAPVHLPSLRATPRMHPQSVTPPSRTPSWPLPCAPDRPRPSPA